MRCPNCLSDRLEDATAISTEPYGQIYDEAFLVCHDCGSRFDESDAVQIPEIIVELYPADVMEIEGMEGEPYQ